MSYEIKKKKKKKKNIKNKLNNKLTKKEIQTIKHLPLGPGDAEKQLFTPESQTTGKDKQQ